MSHIFFGKSNDVVHLGDYWRVVLKYKRMIVAIVVAASVLAVVASLLMKNVYRAEAVIIPISSKGGGGGLSSLASQFGGLASLAGVSLPGGPGELEKIMAILRSRTVTENVIAAENLMPVLYVGRWDAKAGKWKSDDPKDIPDMEDAVLKMKSAVSAVDDKKAKTIKIYGVSFDPRLAARMVNGYVDQLQAFINSNAFTMAKRNRMFIEGQLEENKQDLLEAGKEINDYYKGGRVSSSDAKVDVPLAKKSGPAIQRDNETAKTQDDGTTGQRDDEKVLVANNDAKVEGGEVSESDAALSALLTQKEDLEKKLAEARVVPNVPQQVYLSYLMLRRELLGKMNALLTTQYEMAKIEESKEDLAFQVIDRAVPPMKKFKPKRAQICIMAFFASLFVAVLLAFGREYLAHMKALEATRRNP